MSSFFSYNYIGDNMKLRYRHSIDIVLLIVIVLISLTIMETISFGFDSYNVFSTLVISGGFLLISLVDYMFYKMRFKIAKEKGEKMQGYIVDRPLEPSRRKCSLKCLVNDEVVRIAGTYGISDDDAYNYVCSELKKIEDMGNDTFTSKRFPIDVYVYKNKYYFDLDSVKLDK